MTVAGRSVVRIFLAFAFAYFFSALLRAVIATLAPVFSHDLGLRASELGLLAGAYFLGFAAMQLPVGHALDRIGPKRVLMTMLAVAVVGCCTFAMATTVAGLTVSRVLIGVGVSACLMAPLTCYRARFTTVAQLRSSSWMLMTGSCGMVASTLPVQWLLPYVGWRGLFWMIASLLIASILFIAANVPPDQPDDAECRTSPDRGYREIFRHPVFVRSMPIGFFTYGGMIAMQSLWAGPWLTRVAHWTANEAAAGLFAINTCMLLAFLTWGVLMPRLLAEGADAHRLMRAGLPANLAILAWIVLVPWRSGAVEWSLWFISCTFVSLSHPAVGQAFTTQLAGRALSAFNLVIFVGVFVVQWGIGLSVDAMCAYGIEEGDAFRAAIGGFGLLSLFSYVWFVRVPRRQSATSQ